MRENEKNTQGQHIRHLAIVKCPIWRRQVRLKWRLGFYLVFGDAKRAVWRSPDDVWSFFFKYQPPPSVLDISFEVQHTREVRGTRVRIRKVPAKNDPNQHMENFLDICDLFKTTASTDDAIRLRLFLFTLIGEPKTWWKSLEPNSITTWDNFRNKFATRFFPPAKKADKIKACILAFQQADDETLIEAWERYRRLLNTCPNHGFRRNLKTSSFQY
ncbi:hypothetical protein OSB04_024038 [Centaurea solstitialis]|uniref:Retrotransposon gag domain-containing protein n=1 Tax=Centaurea solstitialis TaxID=347529 RepID=A0AA38SX39_9ASTR|nr:hypothetical protein OSB04_024038 [Centaurea solstitialis]